MKLIRNTISSLVIVVLMLSLVAWDCPNNYAFRVLTDGTVQVQNVSSNNEPAQTAKVKINGTLVATLNAPAMTAGTSWTSIGSVSSFLPVGNYTWEVTGGTDSNCKNSGTNQGPTATPTITLVPSATWTTIPSNTPFYTATPTITLTPFVPSETPTLTPDPPTETPTLVTLTPTTTDTPTGTPTFTPTFTPTGTVTLTPYDTGTPTPTQTVTMTPYDTGTPTPTGSPTVYTATPTITLTPTSSSTPTGTPTYFFSPTPTSTSTITITPGASLTLTPTRTSTVTPTGTATFTATVTGTMTPIAIVTVTATPVPNITGSGFEVGSPFILGLFCAGLTLILLTVFLLRRKV